MCYVLCSDFQLGFSDGGVTFRSVVPPKTQAESRTLRIAVGGIPNLSPLRAHLIEVIVDLGLTPQAKKMPPLRGSEIVTGALVERRRRDRFIAWGSRPRLKRCRRFAARKSLRAVRSSAEGATDS